jgi:hypothetical protein
MAFCVGWWALLRSIGYDEGLSSGFLIFDFSFPRLASEVTLVLGYCGRLCGTTLLVSSQAPFVQRHPASLGRVLGLALAGWSWRVGWRRGSTSLCQQARIQTLLASFQVVLDRTEHAVVPGLILQRYRDASTTVTRLGNNTHVCSSPQAVSLSFIIMHTS